MRCPIIASFNHLIPVVIYLLDIREGFPVTGKEQILFRDETFNLL
jgi:hypothetical protein